MTPLLQRTHIWETSELPTNLYGNYLLQFLYYLQVCCVAPADHLLGFIIRLNFDNASAALTFDQFLEDCKDRSIWSTACPDGTLWREVTCASDRTRRRLESRRHTRAGRFGRKVVTVLVGALVVTVFFVPFLFGLLLRCLTFAFAPDVVLLPAQVALPPPPADTSPAVSIVTLNVALTEFDTMNGINQLSSSRSRAAGLADWLAAGGRLPGSVHSARDRPTNEVSPSGASAATDDSVAPAGPPLAIATQELFSPFAVATFAKALNAVGYHFVWQPRCGGPIGMPSGLGVAVRWPIKKVLFQAFDCAHAEDKMALKGALGVVCQDPRSGKALVVVTTHLQAASSKDGKEIRERQIAIVKEVTVSCIEHAYSLGTRPEESRDKVAAVIVGDFNIARDKDIGRFPAVLAPFGFFPLLQPLLTPVTVTAGGKSSKLEFFHVSGSMGPGCATYPGSHRCLHPPLTEGGTHHNTRAPSYLMFEADLLAALKTFAKPDATDRSKLIYGVAGAGVSSPSLSPAEFTAAYNAARRVGVLNLLPCADSRRSNKTDRLLRHCGVPANRVVQVRGAVADIADQLVKGVWRNAGYIDNVFVAPSATATDLMVSETIVSVPFGAASLLSDHCQVAVRLNGLWDDGDAVRSTV